MTPKLQAQFPSATNAIWLCSHTLGCLPASATEELDAYLHSFAERGPRAWEVWLPTLQDVAHRIARLICAPPLTVTLLPNTTSVQVTVASCFEPKARPKIVCSATEPAASMYAWRSEIRRGFALEVVKPLEGELDLEAMCQAINEQTALVPISWIAAATQSIADVEAICRRAKSVGAHVVLDASLAAGAMPVDVVELGVSFALGSTQGYLCGGPGSAFVYVRGDLIDGLEPGVTGWLGHEAPFSGLREQPYAEGAWRFLGGTPAFAPLFQARAALAIIDQVGGRAIREHNLALTEHAIACIEERGFALKSPREASKRGNAVVFDFSEAAALARELHRERIFVEYRAGCGMFVAPHFYNAKEDIDVLFERIKAIRKGV